MTTKNDEQNQAAQLEKLFAEITNHEQTDEQGEHEGDEVEKELEIDVLNLPPRSKVHLSSGKRLKITLNRPLIRFLLVIVGLLVIALGIYYMVDIELFYIFSHFIDLM